MFFFSIFKMAAIRNLGFLNFLSDEVETTNVHHHINFVKIGQTAVEIAQFFDFQDGRRLPSWILNSQTFGRSSAGEGEYAIAMPNFIKIGQMVSEISII